jgi:D-glycero-beta-D-manno-heptose-7-phosphate kinase
LICPWRTHFNMNHHLKEIVKQFKGKRIIVWGDFILDEYIYTTTGRISREAPVLVTEFESNFFRLGGAGNVVMNINSLGAVPIPVGFIGKNSDGQTLKNILQQNNIVTDYLVELDSYRTPKKSRILSGGENTKKQQVLRIDTLNRFELEKAAYQKIEHILLDLLKDSDILIISDYLFESTIPAVLKKIRHHFPKKTVITDSRNHLPKFKDISIATPNEPEIKNIFPGKHFLKEEDFYFAGRELLERLNADGIIIKRGHKGMVIFEKEKKPVTIDIHGSSNIVDVTGAGDTVISILSLALATKADLVSAAKLANIAAGFVVMKEGAYPINTGELVNELD